MPLRISNVLPSMKMPSLLEMLPELVCARTTVRLDTLAASAMVTAAAMFNGLRLALVIGPSSSREHARRQARRTRFRFAPAR
jgi:hypothetical protein